MQVRFNRRAVPRVCFVITTTRAQRTRPTRRAVRLVRDVMLDEKLVLPAVVDPVEHAAEFVLVRSGEAMTQRDVTIRRDSHEPEPRAARIRLAHSFMNLLERVAHVRESMPTSRERELEVLGGQRLKTAKELLEALVLDRVLALP